MSTVMRDTLVIARRELLERVRSKWFVVVTLLGPLFMVALVVIPALIANSSAKGARIEIIDHSNDLGPPLVEFVAPLAWKATVVPPTPRRRSSSRGSRPTRSTASW